MNEPALLLALSWGAQLPLMLAMTMIWVLHGMRDGVLREWLTADHHTLWHWALGFALPAIMPVVLGELATEWRHVPGAQYRALGTVQAAIALVGVWAAWQYTSDFR
ncbi:MAG: hypothetical protein DDT30_02034 [Dehalococcoidia bacterium]|nr:hypothetical protein [Bacillota bacterium]MBT9166660.1 hypothetical protein [Chloroflexota bacterium]